jgi:hypothetical protein
LKAENYFTGRTSRYTNNCYTIHARKRFFSHLQNFRQKKRAWRLSLVKLAKQVFLFHTLSNFAVFLLIQENIQQGKKKTNTLINGPHMPTISKL